MAGPHGSPGGFDVAASSLLAEHVARSVDAATGDRHRAFLHVEAGARERVPPAGHPLSGLTLSVKDNMAVRGMPMTCGSRHLAEYVAPYTATVVERMQALGAVVIGKTNLDEFACGSSGESSAFGATTNPRDPTRVPGGSSSGAGASVAMGAVDLAIGSDTGGSIRCPASFCGAAALKPSRGLVSRFGLADLAMSLESPAPLAARVGLLSAFMAAVVAPDVRDPLTAGAKWRRPRMDASPDGLRIGVPDEYFTNVEPETEAPVRAALEVLESAGATLVPVALPEVAHALPAYYLLNYAEFSSAMQRYDGFRYGTPGDGADPRTAAEAARASFGAEVKRRILLGTWVTMQEHRDRWYSAALATRDLVTEAFTRAFRDVDLLVGPTMPFRAFELGSRMEDPLAMYAADVLTVPANLAGIPAGSYPLPVDGLPVGLQVLGPRGHDAHVLELMQWLEHHHHPEWADGEGME